jgi:hypothetical protein
VHLKIFFFFFKPHFRFKLFFNCQVNSDIFTLNMVKLFNRWTSSLTLIINLIYHELNLLAFGSKTFETEVLTINWNTLKLGTKLYDTSNQTLFFKNIKQSAWIRSILSRFNRGTQEVFFFFDLTVRTKNLIWFKKFTCYKMGLVPSNYDPYSIDYPIPILSQNLLVQYYFIKVYFFLNFYARNLLFNKQKSLWKQV